MRTIDPNKRNVGDPTLRGRHNVGGNTPVDKTKDAQTNVGQGGGGVEQLNDKGSGDGFGGGGVNNGLSKTLTHVEGGVKAIDARTGAPSPNEAVIQKVLDLYEAGGVKSRKQLVHEHAWVAGNDVKFLVDGPEAFPPLFEDLKAAKKSINVSYYIFQDDKLGNEMADLLIAKAKEGLEVNISVDGIGSVQAWGSPKRAIIDRMAAGGVNVLRNHVLDLTRANTPLGHPDHRKLVLIDGTVGYTGGMNIADHYRDGYHDVMIRVAGPAVQQMQAEWLLSWSYIGAPMDRTAKGKEALRDHYFPKAAEKPKGGLKARVIQAIPGESREIFDTTLALIDGAKKRIQIENPYCTNPEIQDALIAAAKRGVAVEVILPGESDHGFSHLAAKSKYPAMLEAGVKIYEYPGFNHDKVMVVDDKLTSVGSSNFDDVALRHIYELNLVVEDRDFAMDIKTRLFDVDRAKCKEMKAEDISTLDRLTGSFWNLFHDLI